MPMAWAIVVDVTPAALAQCKSSVRFVLEAVPAPGAACRHCVAEGIRMGPARWRSWARKQGDRVFDAVQRFALWQRPGCRVPERERGAAEATADLGALSTSRALERARLDQLSAEAIQLGSEVSALLRSLQTLAAFSVTALVAMWTLATATATDT